MFTRKVNYQLRGKLCFLFKKWLTIQVNNFCAVILQLKFKEKHQAYFCLIE